MSSRGSITFTPKQGSYIVGTLSLIVSLIAPLPVSKFNRKSLLLWGQTCMALSLFATAIAYIYQRDILIIVFICIFITGF
jgi:Na+/melibiose symporter-like transporter